MGEIYLSEVKAGNKVMILKIEGGCTSSIRLCELGLKGNSVEVMKNDVGPLILKTKGTKLAIGRSIARKILIC